MNDVKINLFAPDGRQIYSDVEPGDVVKVTGNARGQDRRTWGRAEGVIAWAYPDNWYLVSITKDPEYEFGRGACIRLKREEFLTPAEYERAFYADYAHEFTYKNGD